MLNLILNIQRNAKSTKLHYKTDQGKLLTICSTEWVVEWNGINSVEIIGGNVLNVTSSDLSFTHRLKCRVDFGDENQFRSCTCNDYQPK